MFFLAEQRIGPRENHAAPCRSSTLHLTSGCGASAFGGSKTNRSTTIQIDHAIGRAVRGFPLQERGRSALVQRQQRFWVAESDASSISTPGSAANCHNNC